MKFILNALLVMTLVAFNASAQPAPQHPPGPRMPPGLLPGASATPPVMPPKDKLSYAIGYMWGGNIKSGRLESEVDVDIISSAIKDVLAGRTNTMNEQQCREIITQLNQVMRGRMMAERQKQMNENKAKGAEFLAKNAKAPGITTLPNGLQYKVLTEGSGPMPKATDTVTVSYKGTQIDGTIFDQGEHFTTKVTGQTTRGWSEILPLMKTGSKWQVFIPSELAYGARGFPPKIGPDAVLVFDMQLLSIAPAPPTPPPTAALHTVPPSPVGSTTPVVSGQIIKVPSAEDLKKGAKIEVITNVPNSQ